MNNIFKLALKIMKKQRHSTLVLICSVALGMMFVTATVATASSIAFTMDNNSKNSYGDFDFQATTNSKEIADTLKENSYVSQAGIMQIAGTFQSESALGEMYIGAVDKAVAELGRLKLSAGKLPESDNEIALEQNTLIYMGMGDSAVNNTLGDTISMNIKTADNKTISKTYTICGILENYSTIWEKSVWAQSSIYADAIITQAEAESISTKQNYITLIKTNENIFSLIENSYTIENSLKGDFGDKVEVDAKFNYNDTSALKNTILMFVIVVVIILIITITIIVSGFLGFIRTQRKQLSLMRSLGATKKQAKRLVKYQAWVVGAIGIPLGIIVGFLMSLLFIFIVRLTTNADTIYYFSPLLPLASLILGIIAIFISTIPIAHSATKTSLVSDIFSIGNKSTPKGRYVNSKKKITPFTLALRDIRHSKLRLAVSILCFSLTFFSIVGIISLYFAEFERYEQNNSFDCDFYLENQVSGNNDDYGVNFLFQTQKFPDNTAQQIKQTILDTGYVDKAEIASSFCFYLLLDDKIRDSEYFNCTLPKSFYTEDFYDKSKNPFYKLEPNVVLDNFNYNSVSTIIDGEEFINAEKDKIIDGEINMDKLNSGEEIILYACDMAVLIKENGYSSWGISDESQMQRAKDEGANIYTYDNFYKAGDTIYIAEFYQDEDENILYKKIPVKIGAIINNEEHYGIGLTLEGSKKMGLTHRNDYLCLKYKDGVDIVAADYEMQQIAAKNNIENISLTSASIAQQKQDMTYTLLGIILLCSVIISVGILSIANNASVKISTKKRELCMMRASGATRGQMYLLLMYDGIIFSTGTAIIGTLAIFFLPVLMKATNWAEQVNLPSLFISIAVLFIVGILTNFLPARKVLNSNIIDGIRTID